MDYIYLVASISLIKWYVHTNGLHLPSGFHLIGQVVQYVHTNGLHFPSGFQPIGQVVCKH